MRRPLRQLVLGLLAMTAIPAAQAQTAAPPVIEGHVYAVTYVEVIPPAAVDGRALLERYRESTRRRDGNLRCELVQRLGQPNQFVILEVWKDQPALEAHGRAATENRAKIATIRGAPSDERVHRGLSVGAVGTGSVPGAVYVVTHVDVIPPRKDDAVERCEGGGGPRDGAGDPRVP